MNAFNSQTFAPLAYVTGGLRIKPSELQPAEWAMAIIMILERSKAKIAHLSGFKPLEGFLSPQNGSAAHARILWEGGQTFPLSNPPKTCKTQYKLYVLRDAQLVLVEETPSKLRRAFNRSVRIANQADLLMVCTIDVGAGRAIVSMLRSIAYETRNALETRQRSMCEFQAEMELVLSRIEERQ